MLKELRLGYSIVRKAKVLKTIGQDCEGLKTICTPVKESITEGRFKINRTLYFFNDITYRGHDLHIIQFDEKGEKRPSHRFAKIQSKKTHWEWIVHQTINTANVTSIAKGARIRWKEEDLFNDLQHRGFAVLHDFNRAPIAQSIRMYLILMAYAICSILTHSLLGQLILSKDCRSIRHMMQEMLEDLSRIPEEVLFGRQDLKQLRFGKDPPVRN